MTMCPNVSASCSLPRWDSSEEMHDKFREFSKIYYTFPWKHTSIHRATGNTIP